MKVYDVDTKIAISDLEAGRQRYSPPGDMRALLGLWFGSGENRRKLMPVSADEILRFDDSMRGSPLYFAISDEIFMLYPIPEEHFTNGLMVVYDPKPAPEPAT